MRTLYLDIDTQQDFVFPSGALYVPGAEKILARVAELNREAITGGHTLLATMDAHTENDPEFKAWPHPSAWPHHCVAGTLGQRKPEMTIVPGMRILTKQSVNCFTNPEMDAMLREGAFIHAVVYGVVTEICVMHAVNGLLDRGLKVEIRSDAIQELDANSAIKFLNDVRDCGGIVRS